MMMIWVFVRMSCLGFGHTIYFQSTLYFAAQQMVIFAQLCIIVCKQKTSHKGGFSQAVS
jgi:hypothetical protein